MNPKYQARDKETLDTIHTLKDKGIEKMAVLLRHSERFYPEAPRMEPFMGLTPGGKTLAMEFGAALPATCLPKLYSSTFGRCIETAYLIDKGFAKKTARFADPNQTDDLLAPFYINDLEAAIGIGEDISEKAFILRWFDKKIDERIMACPEKTARKLSGFVTDRLEALPEGQIALCVSHDWNIFVLQAFVLGMDMEKEFGAGYLEGLVFFEQAGTYFVTSHKTDPVRL